MIEQIEAPISEIPLLDSNDSSFVETTANSAALVYNLSNESLPRSRSAISVLGSQNRVPESTTKLLKNLDNTARSAKERKMRVLKMAAAAVGGGAILGVSAGLAAPLLGNSYIV